MSKKTKVGILVSGNGSNLQAIIDEKIASCEIALVISNKPDVYAIKRAESNNIPVEIINNKNFETREEFAIKHITHYGVAKYINSLDLSANQKIIVVGDFKAAFIIKHSTLFNFSFCNCKPFLSIILINS